MIERFETTDHNWWKDINIQDYGAYWGGEVAAANLTGYLKPAKTIIYTNEPLVKLVLKNRLVHSGKFRLSRQKQRLIYDDHFPVNIIPFGMIANEDGSITWPPDHENRMSTVGFQECFQHAVSVKLSSNPELVVKVINLAGLALLKLISWGDNPERHSKDAPDLFLIIRHYLDAGNLDRLFEEASDLVEEDSYDYDLASARLLGRDVRNISSPTTKTKLIEILKRENNSKQGHKIALDILQSDVFQSESYERALEYFNALLEGMVKLIEHPSKIVAPTKTSQYPINFSFAYSQLWYHPSVKVIADNGIFF